MTPVPDEWGGLALAPGGTGRAVCGGFGTAHLNRSTGISGGLRLLLLARGQDELLRGQAAQDFQFGILPFFVFHLLRIIVNINILVKNLTELVMFYAFLRGVSPADGAAAIRSRASRRVARGHAMFMR